jgi:hypothetical protein
MFTLLQVSHHLRWLSAQEVSALLGYPTSFTFPAALAERQRCALLGNGLSLTCAIPMLQYLLYDYTLGEGILGQGLLGEL